MRFWGARAACACHTEDGFSAARARVPCSGGEPGGTQMTGAAPSASQLVIASGVRLAGGSCAAPASSAGTIARWAIRDKSHTICGRLALAQPLLPGDAQGMDLRPQAPEIPSAADEVPIDDLLAGVRTTAELNELIREGLAAARRGARIFPACTLDTWNSIPLQKKKQKPWSTAPGSPTRVIGPHLDGAGDTGDAGKS